MSSLVHARRDELKALGEYVVLANIESGWFAVFESTLAIQTTKSTSNGRVGPNLIVYRTKDQATNARDHYVVPHTIFSSMVTDSTVAEAKIKSSRRWNFTLKNHQLHVTHGSFVDIEKYYGARLIVEDDVALEETSTTPASIQIQTAEAIEGLARESVRVTRSRNGQLREAAIRNSRGVCEACMQDFSLVLDGLGVLALQVHHKNQLSETDEAVLTNLNDLAVLCANCHCIVHSQRDKPMEVEQLRMLFQSAREDA